MNTLKNLAQQYQDTCINYEQLLRLWESTFTNLQEPDREEKLWEYWVAMKAMRQKLVLLVDQSSQLGSLQVSSRPSAA